MVLSTPSDATKPVTSITSPANFANVSGTVSISADATDNVAVAGVRLVVNGAYVGTEDTTSPYSFTWDSKTVSNGTNTIEVVARDTSNNLATSTPVNLLVNNIPTTTPSTNNLVTNGNFETAGTGGNPASWNRGGWGTNTRTFNYPVTGDTGNGAEVVVSGYSNGDAKWYFDPVAVVPNTEYSISNKYKSTINSEVLIRYTLTDGTFQYQFLSALANSNNTWQNFSQTVVVPVNATHMTLFHMIAQNGTLVIDNVSVK